MVARLGRACLFALVFAAGLLFAAPPAAAQDGPVFLVVNLDEGGFDTTFSDESSSHTVIVNIGTFIGGGDALRDVTFLSATLATIPLGDLTVADLDGHMATIVGSYETGGSDPEPHLVTPEDPDLIDGGVPPEIQAAVFAASPDLVTFIDPSSEDGGPFLTTQDIAEFIAAYELTETYDADEIADFLFGGAVPLETSNLSCEAEGELFPHNPGEPIFNFTFAFDDDGALTYDVCTEADVDVKPEVIKLSQKGVLSVTIYSGPAFDASEIDEDTIEIGGVAPVKVHSATGKIVCDFDVSELYDDGDGPLNEGTTELTIAALLKDGTTCIAGTDSVKVK